MQKHITISIVGAGASGTVLAIFLLEELRVPAVIRLFEKSSSALHRGAAYSSHLPYEPLNVPAGKMSIYPDKPNDFFHFITAHKDPTATQESFVSRRWFGDYLEERIKQAIEKKNAQVSLEKIAADIVDVELSSDNTYLLTSSDDADWESDVAVLATGNEPPQSFKIEGDYPSNKYISNPWAIDLEKIPTDANVLIIGTGLTMIDIAASLNYTNHLGKIFALSRRGKLPCVHKASANAEPVPINDTDSLQDVFLKLRAEVKRQAKQGIHWSKVIDNLRPHITSLWNNFSAHDKEVFLKRLRHFWEVHRHRMPPASQAILSEMTAQNNLEVLAGAIEKIQWCKDSNSFEINFRNRKKVRAHIHADYIVNCSGPASHCNESQPTLIGNLLKKGMAKADEFNLGIETDAAGRLSEHISKLFAIGPLRKASDWESTAMREIVIQARSLASEIVSVNADLNVLIEELKKLDVHHATVENLKQALLQIKLTPQFANTFFEQSAANNQNAVKLLIGDVECSLIKLSGGATTSIYQNNSNTSVSLVVDGTIYQTIFSYKHEVLKEQHNNLIGSLGFVIEHPNTIQRLQNLNNSKPVTILEVRLNRTNRFDDVKLFDISKKQIGILSGDANEASWDLPASSFKEIVKNNFVYEPLLEFMI